MSAVSVPKLVILGWLAVLRVPVSVAPLLPIVAASTVVPVNVPDKVSPVNVPSEVIFG